MWWRCNYLYIIFWFIPLSQLAGLCKPRSRRTRRSCSAAAATGGSCSNCCNRVEGENVGLYTGNPQYFGIPAASVTSNIASVSSNITYISYFFLYIFYMFPFLCISHPHKCFIYPSTHLHTRAVLLAGKWGEKVSKWSLALQLLDATNVARFMNYDEIW